jgi:hypothetical protein
LPITHERGYVIPAIGDQYVECAYRLRDSILIFHPNANIAVVTVDMLPHGDLGGWNNDWQMFQLSPYRQTIKLEADMLCTSPFDHWWTMFEKREVVISRGARDFYSNLAQSRFYRKTFDANNLPDVYNAITYWRLSTTARDFFQLVRDIFQNWNDYKKILKFAEDVVSTDLVYAVAAKIIGEEHVTLPAGLGPTIVHMKQHVNHLQTPDWTKELVWEHSPLRINTVAQHGMFHYHVKDWQ